MRAAREEAGQPGSSKVHVRLGTSQDAPHAACLHAQNISEGFLSTLGVGFLSRLYRRVADSPGSFLLVAEADGEVVGFLAGALDTTTLYRRFLVRDGVAVLVRSAPAILRHLPRALETLRHGRRHAPAGSTANAEGPRAAVRGDAELLAIAVDPSRRGARIGTALVDRFLEEVFGLGAASAHVVVAAGNLPAIALYSASGFVAASEFELHKGTTSLLMRCLCPPARSDAAQRLGQARDEGSSRA